LGKTGLFLHPIVQAICFKKSVESLNSCQKIVQQNTRISPLCCTGNMLQKACGKFEFLSNNCSAKKVYWNSCQTIVRQKGVFFYPVVQAICFKKHVHVESFNSCQTIVRQNRCIGILVKQFFVKKGVFLHRIVQVICFKNVVESLKSSQTIVRQKRCIGILVKQMFVRKDVFFHPVVQAISFKKPVESLNCCQTIVRQNRCIGILVKQLFVKKANFSILLYRQYASKSLW
jgi:hypothetical protein